VAPLNPLCKVSPFVVLNETAPAELEALMAEKLLLEFEVRVAVPLPAPCTKVPSRARVDDGPPEKVTGDPTIVFDQLVNGVVAADVELEVLLPPPAHAIKRVGIKDKMIFFKSIPK
jgi:hypothetical protein